MPGEDLLDIEPGLRWHERDPEKRLKRINALERKVADLNMAVTNDMRTLISLLEKLQGTADAKASQEFQTVLKDMQERYLPIKQ